MTTTSNPGSPRVLGWRRRVLARLGPAFPSRTVAARLACASTTRLPGGHNARPAAGGPR
jgi:hypothetical protein